jgi:hypothetical protein
MKIDKTITHDKQEAVGVQVEPIVMCGVKSGQSKNYVQAQIFTPEKVTNDMLDLLDQDHFTDHNTYFLEPTCGKGDMLIVILDRIYTRLVDHYSKENDYESKEKALADTLFRYHAIEIDEKLVIEARTRVFQFFSEKSEEIGNTALLLNFIIARSVSESIECKDFFEFFGTTFGEAKKSSKKRENT